MAAAEPVREVVAVAVAPPLPPVPRFEQYTLSATELFAFDRAELRMPQARLDKIASALGRHAEVNDVVITGYTDRITLERRVQ